MMSVHTQALIEELYRSLEAERTRIFGILRAIRPSAPQADEMSEVEVAQRATEGTPDLDLQRHEGSLLEEVKQAIARIHGGVYGVSEESGEPIPFERLAALPWARQSLGE